MAKTNISEAMQAAIGGELSRSTSFPITDSDIRRWAVAIYYPEDPPRLFWDADYAAQTRYGGLVAPEEFNPFAWMTADGPRKVTRRRPQPRPDRDHARHRGPRTEVPAQRRLRGRVRGPHAAR